MRHISIAALLLLVGWAECGSSEEPVVLAEPMKVGTEVATKFHLVLRGTVHVGDRDENVAGQALLVYPEKALALDDAGLPGTVARYYEDARAKFVFGKSEDPRQLRPDMRLAIGKAGEKGLEIWSPSGPFTSDEIELIQDTLDTTQLVGLLPKESVKVGDTWEPSESVQRRLCNLEQSIASTIACKLEKMDDSTASILISGKIHGLAYGSEVKSNVEATVTFDRKQSRIKRVSWKQIDSRAPSPVSPAGAYEVTIQIERSASASPVLADGSLSGVDRNPPESAKYLLHEDPHHRFRFYYDRSWHMTMMEPNKAILRRLVGNEMVAQLDVAVLGDNKAVAEITAEQLQQWMIEAGEIKVEEVVRSESIPSGGDHQLRLVRATGTKGELKLNQRHYLARDASGRQILFSFLTEPSHDEKLGDADLAVVQSLEFGNKTAGKSPPTRK